MELIFNKRDDVYVALVNVTDAFSLYIKRPTSGSILIESRGSEDPEFVQCGYFNSVAAGSVWSKDFSFKSYPKDVKITSRVPVTQAVINTTGDGSGSISSAEYANIITRLEKLEGGVGDTTPSIIDTNKEVTDFLDGYTPEDTLKNVIESETSVADEDAVSSLFS